MMFEKAKIQFDLHRLKSEFEQIRSTLEPVMVSKTYGGWSITSSTGSYRDGWLHKGSRFTKVSDEMSEQDYAKYVAESGRAKPILDYKIPTEACLPYLATVVDSLANEGLVPRRVRLALLKPGAATDWHQDAPSSIYLVRLHIPILTNEGCTFETETETTHFAADGSGYFLPVNNVHRVKNSGDEDRVHFIADIYDTERYTQNFQYTGPRPKKT